MNAERPSREQMRDFLLGRIEPHEHGALAKYLEAHPDLLDQMIEADTSNDSLLADLRHSASSFQRESDFQRGLESARALSPKPANPENEIDSHPPESSRVGPYQLIGRINRRGMSVVWRATDTRDGTPAAVKLLPSARLDDADSVARFRREMSMVARLQHRGIVRCLGSGETDGVPYLAMELLEGLDLAELLRRRGPLPVPVACALARHAAIALDHAHRGSLVHRDVKPSNIFLTNSGEVKLLDLGLARCLRAEDDSLTHADQVLGTMDYMSPEQAFEPATADARSDLYSLGCTLYALLAGKAPFAGGDCTTVLKKALAHASRPVPDIRLARPEAPGELAALVAALCAKAPAERPSRAGDAAAALARWADDSLLRGLAGNAFPQPPTRSESPKPRRPALWAAMLILAFGAPAAWWMRPTTSALVDTTSGRFLLVANGSFEQGMRDWSPQIEAHSTVYGSFTASSEKSFQGRWAAMCRSVAEFRKAGYAFLGHPIPVEPGRRYVLSAAFETSDMKTGSLSVDLSEPSYHIRLESRQGYPGWQFLHEEFTAASETVRIRLVHDGDHCPRGETGYVDAVALTPAEEFMPAISSMSLPPDARAAPGAVLVLPPAPAAGPVVSLHVSGNGDRIRSLDSEADIRAHELPGGTFALLSGSGKIRGTAMQASAFDPMGERAAVISPQGKVILRKILQTEPVAELAMPAKACAVAWSPDGARLAMLDEAGGIRVTNLPEWRPIADFNTGLKTTGRIAWSPDGSSLAVVAGQSLMVLDARTGETRWQTRQEEMAFNCLTWSTDSRSLYSGTSNGKLISWNLALEAPVGSVQAHEGAVNAIVASADGTRLATAGDDASVAIWDSQTVKRIGRASALNSRIRSLAFSPTGSNTIFIGTHNGLVMKWEANMTGTKGASAP